MQKRHFAMIKIKKVFILLCRFKRLLRSIELVTFDSKYLYTTRKQFILKVGSSPMFVSLAR